MAPTKTNSMRRLEAEGVLYEPYYFAPSIHSAQGVAEALGFPVHVVYKSLVVMPPDERPVLVLVAGDRELDLSLLARELGVKKVRMATQKEAEKHTRLQVGGISPLALLDRGFSVYIDLPAVELDELLLSAGRRGINLRLRVEDLVRITGAEWVEATTG
jgi:Cys-tRNA(Pro)/Cys-tRNA(Cys) deacylase